MKFRTEIPTEPFPFEIDYQSQLMFMGSCFSDNIGQKIINSGFSAHINPFGVLYNPISLKNGLDILMTRKTFTKSDLIQSHGLFHSFSHHGSFSRSSETESLKLINNTTQIYAKKLSHCNILFLTFGTAFVYQYKDSQSIVSNCHKIPAKAFNRFSLSPQDIINSYQTLIKELKSFNPKLKIVFTVSPIRHWKNGAHENQLSKAKLLLAIDALVQQYEFTYYYPSYELVMDDLRDYRFYSDDLVHLNTQAVDYIYQHFQNSFFSKETKQIKARVYKLKQALNHRPFNTETKEYQDFLKSTQEKIALLKATYPEINI